jgi:hypothetical protein
MNSRDVTINSGERLSFFKLFSEKGFKVEIPIIQRDYAHGRDSEYEVRQGFLAALYGYLKEGRPNRDLDFVYGSLLEDGAGHKFVPLDGQQRLTTLFLLHWYLAHLSGNSESFKRVISQNKRSMFTYETRASSSEFCDALVAFDVDMAALDMVGVGGGRQLSNTVRDSGWFYLSWGYDPTIQSMLTMLDAIHMMFHGSPEFYQRLIDTESPVITFLFLNFHTFGLTDDLYIKMNARGKPLTEFENFKAKFEQKIKVLGSDDLTHRLDFIGDLVGDYKYFIHKIDTDWADIFWAYRYPASKDGSFDKELMAFIALVIANYRLLDDEELVDGEMVGADKLFSVGKVRSLSFQEYSELGCFTTGLIGHLIKIMDLLYHDGLEGGRLRLHSANNGYYSEEDVFKGVIANNTSYAEKLRFYAFYTYFLKSQDQAGLIDWLRVIYNLTENAPIDSPEQYRRALMSIGELSGKCDSILDALKDGCDVTAFTSNQIFEERIKASLIQRSPEWSRRIIALEKHPFFSGQIGCVLSFAGILEFYRKNSSCDWDDEEDKEYMAAFKNYADAGAGLFSLIKDSSSSIDYLWERAVLSKGIYFTPTTAGRWNMLSTRLAKNNIERDYSWKRMLRISVQAVPILDSRQAFVKAVFDDPMFNSDDIQNSLVDICETASEGALEEWQRLFIAHPALFKEINQGFIVREAGAVYLLKESQRNHYHSELFTLTLSRKLKDENISPFYMAEYGYVRGRDELPYADLGCWRWGSVNYRLHIRYIVGQYNVHFFAENSGEYSDDILGILEASNMVANGGISDNSYVHICDASSEASDFLVGFCESIRALTDE